MKQLLILILALPVFSFTAPKADDAKNNWVYELVKPDAERFKKEASNMDDYLIMSDWSASCDGRIYWGGWTTNVSVDRWWTVTFFVTGTGAPQLTYDMLVPAYTYFNFGSATPIAFGCNTQVTGFAAGLK